MTHHHVYHKTSTEMHYWKMVLDELAHFRVRKYSFIHNSMGRRYPPKLTTSDLY